MLVLVVLLELQMQWKGWQCHWHAPPGLVGWWWFCSPHWAQGADNTWFLTTIFSGKSQVLQDVLTNWCSALSTINLNSSDASFIVQCIHCVSTSCQFVVTHNDNTKILMPGARLEKQFLCLADLFYIPEKGPLVIVEILSIALLMM